MDEPRQFVFAIAKGASRYVFFLHDAASLFALYRVLGAFAADPELDFTWHDAAVLSYRASQQVKHSAP